MRQRARADADNLTVCYRNKQKDVSFSCVCPVLDNEFRHNIVKKSADPLGYHVVDTNNNVMTKLTGCIVVMVP